MHSIAQAVVKSGILSPETLAEFKRWGFQVEGDATDLPRKPEEVVSAIEEALQDEGLVLTRETDLEAINCFLQTSQHGVLHVVVEGETDESADIDCLFGRTPLGEYIIKWHSDSIEDVMTNGKTHLKLWPTNDEVFFTRARELYFGRVKTFVVCTPHRG
jgi:hypothetical protein